MKPKILFIGGTPVGLEVLKTLVDRNETIVRAIVFKEDKNDPLKTCEEINKICADLKIPSEVCGSIENSRIPQILKSNPDIAFSCGWHSTLPKDLHENIPLGCLAFHDSLLPKYRGFSSTAWAIQNGEKETGVTLFKVKTGIIDSGDIYDQKVIKISENETSSDIYPRIIKSCVELCEKFLNDLEKGKVKYRKQDDTKATFTPRRISQDNVIDWNYPANKIFNLIRALTPPYSYPWTVLKGKKIYIKKACLVKEKPVKKDQVRQNIGKIIKINDDGITVQCAEGKILISDIISEDSQELKANRFFFF